jgi:hypothetical protein
MPWIRIPERVVMLTGLPAISPIALSRMGRVKRRGWRIKRFVAISTVRLL